MMLLVVQQKGHPARKSSARTILESLHLETGLMWSNSGKMGRLTKTDVRTYIV